MQTAVTRAVIKTGPRRSSEPRKIIWWSEALFAFHAHQVDVVADQDAVRTEMPAGVMKPISARDRQWLARHPGPQHLRPPAPAEMLAMISADSVAFDW